MSFLLVAAFLALAAALAAAVWVQWDAWEQRLKTARVTYALINAERAQRLKPEHPFCLQAAGRSLRDAQLVRTPQLRPADIPLKKPRQALSLLPHATPGCRCP